MYDRLREIMMHVDVMIKTGVIVTLKQGRPAVLKKTAMRNVRGMIVTLLQWRLAVLKKTAMRIVPSMIVTPKQGRPTDLKKTAMRNVPCVIVTLKQGRPAALKNQMTYAEFDFIKTMKQQKKQEGWHAKMYWRHAACQHPVMKMMQSIKMRRTFIASL